MCVCFNHNSDPECGTLNRGVAITLQCRQNFSTTVFTFVCWAGVVVVEASGSGKVAWWVEGIEGWVDCSVVIMEYRVVCMAYLLAVI